MFKITRHRVVIPTPPLWLRVLTLGRIEYVMGWQVQLEVQVLGTDKITRVTTEPPPRPPTPNSVSLATARALNQAIAQLHTAMRTDMEARDRLARAEARDRLARADAQLTTDTDALSKKINKKLH